MSFKLKFFVFLIFILTYSFLANANNCHIFYNGNKFEGVLPPWAKEDPFYQYSKYKAAVWELSPNLTDAQVASIHKIVSGNHFNLFVGPIEKMKAQLALFKFEDEVIAELVEYVRKIEGFVGHPADHLMIRTEQYAGQPFDGHQHPKGGYAVATSTLWGKGTFFEFNGVRYETGTKQTLIFDDKNGEGLFHGTPHIIGRRVLLLVGFFP